MKSKFKIASGAVLMSLSLGANAASGVIDLFTAAQGNTFGAYVDTTNDSLDTGREISSGVGGTVNDSDALGGNRDIFVSSLSGSDGTLTTATVAGTSSGIFNFATGPSTQGRVQIQWDGADGAGAGIDETGLGGLDITAGGTLDAFVIGVVFSDFDFDFSFTAYTDVNNYTIVKLQAQSHVGPSTGTPIPFSAFGLPSGSYITPDGLVVITQVGTGGDLSNLGALTLDINQDGISSATGNPAYALDVQLDDITTVPETGILALMGLGLFGVFSGQIRRNKKTV